MSDDKSNYNRLSELLGHFSIANGSFGGNDGGRSRRGFVRLTAVECNENLIVLSKSRELFSLLCCHHCCFFYCDFCVLFAGVSDSSICSRGYHAVSHDKTNRPVQTAGWFPTRSSLNSVFLTSLFASDVVVQIKHLGPFHIS